MTGYVVGEIFVWIMVVSFVISFCYAIYETATYFEKRQDSLDDCSEIGPRKVF